MLTDDDIKAIEARALHWRRAKTGPSAESIIGGDIPALLADRVELVALAQELASGLQGMVEPSAYEAANSWYRYSAREALARARAAGLLEV